jgi:MFS family permease
LPEEVLFFLPLEAQEWLYSNCPFSLLSVCLFTVVFVPSLTTTGVVLYGLGSGYNQSIRSILTLSTPEEHRAITYSVMGIMEATGTLVGAPFWPLMYQIGLKGNGYWVGLPFVVTAGLMAGVWVTLYVARVHAV